MLNEENKKIINKLFGGTFISAPVIIHTLLSQMNSEDLHAIQNVTLVDIAELYGRSNNLRREFCVDELGMITCANLEPKNG